MIRLVNDIVFIFSVLTAVLYVLCIAVSLSINGVIPLYYELGVESAYPVHEGLSCSFITVINNISGMIYFLLFQIPILSAGESLAVIVDQTETLKYRGRALMCKVKVALSILYNIKPISLQYS